jgi:hypothetical protein
VFFRSESSLKCTLFLFFRVIILCDEEIKERILWGIIPEKRFLQWQRRKT